MFFSVVSFAGQGDDFSAREILIQALNFSLFVGLLYFFLRKPAQTFFHKRREDFLFLEREALQQEKAKKKELDDWNQKVKLLNEKEADIEVQAQTEGDRFIFQKKSQLEKLRLDLKKSSDFFLQLERAKAQRNILEKWKGKIVKEAESVLASETAGTDFFSRNQEGFVWEIEAYMKKRPM